MFVYASKHQLDVRNESEAAQLGLVTYDSDMLQKQACSAFVYRCLHVTITVVY